MIDLRFLSAIRRWALRDKMRTREIERRTGMSRNTINKYLRKGTVPLVFQLGEAFRQRCKLREHPQPVAG